MGRRINLSDLADEPPLEQARVPGFVGTPTRARLRDVATNPRNTRRLKSATVQRIADSMRVHGQLQPCAVVTRAVFLEIFPEHESLLGDAAFVQVTGAQRRAAAAKAGLDDLEIVVKNELAESRAGFLAATAAENIDRESLDPIEEAEAVQQVVEAAGSGKAAAEHFGKTGAWVTQKLNLLKLAQAVQEALRAQEIPVREVRDLHTKPQGEQLEILAALRAERARTEELTAVNGPPDHSVPAQRTDRAAARPRQSRVALAIRRLGGTPPKIAESLRTELSADDLRALVSLLSEGL